MKEEGISISRHLDMGCGLGSVLMMVAWKFPDLTSTGIEAQKISCGLARRSIRYNGASDRITVYNGDLRDFSVLDADAKFPIITGTPPYFKAGEGALSAKVDQKACLFEFRGGVEEYIKSASHYLTENGHFIVVESSLGKERFDIAAKLYSRICISFNYGNRYAHCRTMGLYPKRGKTTAVLHCRLGEGGI